MKTISWDDDGSSVQLVKAVNDGIPFILVVRGQLAKTCVATLGAGSVGMTPEMLYSIVGVVALLAIASLVLYALAKGYKITGKARLPNGTEYELSFEPKPTT